MSSLKFWYKETGGSGEEDAPVMYLNRYKRVRHHTERTYREAGTQNEPRVPALFQPWYSTTGRGRGINGQRRWGIKWARHLHWDVYLPPTAYTQFSIQALPVETTSDVSLCNQFGEHFKFKSGSFLIALSLWLKEREFYINKDASTLSTPLSCPVQQRINQALSIPICDINFLYSYPYTEITLVIGSMSRSHVSPY